MFKSTPCFSASLRTSGVTYGTLSPEADTVADAAAGVLAASFFGSSLTGSSSSAGAASSSAGAASSSAGAAAAFASPMRAMTAPTSTVSSSSARISTMVPATGDGISVSTLSVETSRSGSSTSTVSPTALSHWVMVPSVTDSPSSGISTSVAAPVAAGASGAASFFGSSSSAGAGASSAGASLAGVSSASPIIAMTPPTSTVSSSSALISRMTPATGEGISVSTLSVETSSNGSSTSTVSPTDFNHWVIVPSVTDSPSSGISTENAIILRLLASRVVKTETNTPKDTDSICDVWCSGHIKLNRCPLQ